MFGIVGSIAVGLACLDQSTWTNAEHMTRPIVLLHGRHHRLSKDQFILVNDPSHAKRIFRDCFDSDRYLDAPMVDYERHSLICIFYTKRRFLSSLAFHDQKTKGQSLAVYFTENWIDNIFFGVNDNVANAPYLFLVVPKWKGNIKIYGGIKKRGQPIHWELKASIS